MAQRDRASAESENDAGESAGRDEEHDRQETGQDRQDGEVSGRSDSRTEEDRRADNERSPEAGLSDSEAARRFERYGANELAEHHRSAVVEFLSHFWGPIPWMIEAAAVLSGVTGRITDLVVILVMLALNGVVGFLQERQAGNAIEALKQQVAAHARVKRDEQWRDVLAREVVPGDLVHVGVDEIVPADGELLDGTASVDESALTGESLPVDKQSGDGLYSGSSLSRGEVDCRVTATGSRTRFGRTAELVQGEAPPSHFQRAVLRIGRYLVVVTLVLAAVIIGLSLVRGASVTTTLELALVVAIAGIPVAMPTVLSVTMAVGARALARHRAIVSKLPALEELAGVEMLLVDKTGTITQNDIQVQQAASLDDGFASEDVLLSAALSSDPDGSDPIDTAVFDAVDSERLAEYQRDEFEPFDPQLKRAQATASDRDGNEVRVAKGAVQSIVELTGAAETTQEEAEQRARDFAGQGMRTLAVASADNGADWRLVGVLALRDPPREDAAATLRHAGELGVTVRMLTGDRPEIGTQIADEVDLPSDVRDSTSVREADDDTELAQTVDEVGGFAEVVPEDKYRIAGALQERDQIVAMTGDGVNDTPALRRAEVGIAVSSATDAARAASEVVLTEPGLSVVIDGLRRARETFRRMTNYTVYRISETIRVVLFVTITIGVLGFFPVTPIQIILLALLNDLAILSCSYDRAEPASRPARWRMRQVLTVASSMGAIGVVASIGLVLLGTGPLDLDDQTIRTLLYLKLSVAGHLTYFAARTRGPFWASRPAWITVLAVVGTQIVATVIALTGFLMPSISWPLVGLAWGWAAIWLFGVDGVKLLLNRIIDAKDDTAASEPAT